ncbi:MAG TPA: hypothetical protein VN643_20325 [Pyrinomonadaceae bacterium]|nr:hypothetical protein [Pyrinomonadaceae bacterium]
MAPATKRASSIDSSEDGLTLFCLGLLSGFGESLGLGVSILRVGENESSSDAPHEGHEVSLSARGFEQAGHAIIWPRILPYESLDRIGKG